MKGISMSFRGLKGRESVIILSKVGFLVMGTPLLHLLDIKSRDGWGALQIKLKSSS